MEKKRKTVVSLILVLGFFLSASVGGEEHGARTIRPKLPPISVEARAHPRPVPEPRVYYVLVAPKAFELGDRAKVALRFDGPAPPVILEVTRAELRKIVVDMAGCRTCYLRAQSLSADYEAILTDNDRVLAVKKINAGNLGTRLGLK